MKKTITYVLLAIFLAAAVAFGVLYFTTTQKNNATISTLTGERDTLTADVAAKTAEIAL